MTRGITPCRVILTDDPLRAKMLVAHHLEYASLVSELGDVLVYSGSYKDMPLAVASTGTGSSGVLAFLNEASASGAGASEAVFIGSCVSTTSRYGVRSVILAAGGSRKLLDRALAAAEQYDIKAASATVLQPGGLLPEEGCIIEEVTGAFYELARAGGADALSILTVAENTRTDEKMEEHEVRSRFYAASRLAFEMLALR